MGQIFGEYGFVTVTATHRHGPPACVIEYEDIQTAMAALSMIQTLYALRFKIQFIEPLDCQAFEGMHGYSSSRSSSSPPDCSLQELQESQEWQERHNMPTSRSMDFETGAELEDADSSNLFDQPLPPQFACSSNGDSDPRPSKLCVSPFADPDVSDGFNGFDEYVSSKPSSRANSRFAFARMPIFEI